MAKTTCLFALFVAVMVCAEAIRIDPHPTYRRKEDKRPTDDKADARCKKFKKDDMYPNGKDCRSYLKCIRGHGRVRKCPSNYKFDTNRHCISPTTKPPPDCGKPHHSPSDVECTKNYGQFPAKSDCHKYFTCNGFAPTVYTCPEHQVYNDAIGSCVEGDECPKQMSEVFKCPKSDGKYPDVKNCRRFIHCVSFKPISKKCPSGTAFDPESHSCTKEQLKKCPKNNDIMSIDSDE